MPREWNGTCSQRTRVLPLKPQGRTLNSLQSRDPSFSNGPELPGLVTRVKLISKVILAFFILTALISKNVAVLLCLYGLSLVLASASRIGLGFFLKRTWVFIPLFSIFVVIPAIFSVFSPGEAVLHY